MTTQLSLVDERDFRQVVAAVFEAHDFDDRTCSCGWTLPEGYTDDEARYAYHDHLTNLIAFAIMPVRPIEGYLRARLRGCQIGYELLQAEHAKCKPKKKAAQKREAIVPPQENR